MLKSLARLLMFAPFPARRRISTRCDSDVFGGRPIVLPRERARSIPAFVLSSSMSRSICATAPNTFRSRRPAVLVRLILPELENHDADAFVLRRLLHLLALVVGGLVRSGHRP